MNTNDPDESLDRAMTGPSFSGEQEVSSQRDWREFLPLDEKEGAKKTLLGEPPWSLAPDTFVWRGALAVMGIAGVVGVSHLLGDRVSEDNDILVYLGSLTALSLYLGRFPALLAAGLCLLMLSVGPFHSGLLTAVEPFQSWLSLVLFLFVADQVARLANRVRQEAWAADQEARLLSLFNQFSREVSILTDRPRVEEYLLDFLSERLGFSGQISSAPQGGAFQESHMRQFCLGSERYLSVQVCHSNPEGGEFWTEVVTQLAQTARRSFERIAQTETQQRASILEATQKIQTALINSMSHDLQTPLASISGVFEVLGNEDLVLSSEERIRLIELGASQTERLLHLAKNVIGLSKLDGGGLRLELKDVSLEEIARIAIERFDPRDRGRISFKAEGAPAEVRGDTLLLTQVVFNLLDNALKFSSEDSKVLVRVLGESKTCRLQVVDSGFGIEPAEKDRIFERFFRGTTPKRIPGSGLGLSICKSLVELHGGTLNLESLPGVGTTFSLVIPSRASAPLVPAS